MPFVQSYRVDQIERRKIKRMENSSNSGTLDTVKNRKHSDRIQYVCVRIFHFNFYFGCVSFLALYPKWAVKRNDRCSRWDWETQKQHPNALRCLMTRIRFRDNSNNNNHNRNTFWAFHFICKRSAHFAIYFVLWCAKNRQIVNRFPENLEK